MVLKWLMSQIFFPETEEAICQTVCVDDVFRLMFLKQIMIIDYGCRVKFQSRASIQNIIKCHYPQLPADRMSTPASSVVPSYFQNSVSTCFFTDENISINQLKI